MVSVEILTRCSYETLTAKFVQVVKVRLFTVVLNSYAKITFLPKRPLLTYVYGRQYNSSRKGCGWLAARRGSKYKKTHIVAMDVVGLQVGDSKNEKEFD
jgi:hypothetical protein